MASKSGDDPAKVGMMGGAFFVSRVELLSWVNGFFQLGLSKVEQCANGAVYCQIVEACHPGKVAMRKVNWMARSDHEFIPNYKVLQAAFDKCSIQRNIDVDKLIRGRYQDNLEMLQWMKHYFDSRYVEGPDPYNPHDCRRGLQLPDWSRPSSASAKPNGRSAEGDKRLAARPASATEASNQEVGTAQASNREVASPAAGVAKPKTRAKAKGNSTGGTSSGYSSGTREPLVVAATPGLLAEHESLKEEVVDLKIIVDGLECERDYYFRKLRDIEILCQTMEADPSASEQVTVPKLIQNVQAILYAKDDDDPAPEC